MSFVELSIPSNFKHKKKFSTLQLNASFSSLRYQAIILRFTILKEKVPSTFQNFKSQNAKFMF